MLVKKKYFVKNSGPVEIYPRRRWYNSEHRKIKNDITVAIKIVSNTDKSILQTPILIFFFNIFTNYKKMFLFSYSFIIFCPLSREFLGLFRYKIIRKSDEVNVRKTYFLCWCHRLSHAIKILMRFFVWKYIFL